jgi:hypothetical protein
MDSSLIAKISLTVIAGGILVFLVWFFATRESQGALNDHGASARKEEGFADYDVSPSESSWNQPAYQQVQFSRSNLGSNAEDTEGFVDSSNSNSGNVGPVDPFPRDRLTAEDLLPSDAANSQWAQVNPAGQGDVANQNYLTSGWTVGINTVAGSLRNPNLQLRAETPNPKGAWPIMNSTIEPDTMRKGSGISGDDRDE